ncbi:MAG: amidohydrolase, partial [Acidimicrobiales bacterium]|nr:amidohydrolase [Acidimicrobiales bacterium]
PSHTPEAATAELLRAAELGHRGAVVGLLESDEPVFDESWERFWATADDCGLPISFHLGKGMHSLAVRPGSWRFPATVAVSPLQLDEIITGLVFSGILQRYPNVHAVFGEAGLGWIPYLLDRLDHEHDKYRHLVTDVVLDERPSTYFRRQIVLTYEEDEFGLEMIERIGAQSVMWASDYPHGDSTWPHSRESLAESQLARLPAEDQRLILWDNAARLYRIEPPAPT